jgi:glycosyltransferase involved in cell wall biosynthesis
MGFRLTFVRTLRSEIKANQDLDAFVVGSNYMAKLIAENGIDHQRIHAIPLYALPPETTLSVTREPDLLLFAGQLIRSKGIDTLLEALALTEHPCRLAIAGHGRQEDMFRQMVKNLGIEERVSFLGKLSHEDLAEWFSKAACVVVPSRYPETFGLVGPEAMRYGAALIGTKVGAIEEWLEDGVTGITVPPNDSHAMARAIDQISENPEMAVQMGMAGKKRYEESYRPVGHIHALCALFETLVEVGARRV